MRNLDFISMFFKYKSVWMNQIHRILSMSITFQQMTSANAKSNQKLNRISSLNLIDSLMNQLTHSDTIFFLSSFGICTYFL